ncbi:MAG: insecticidal delta-endotoxin Cry8Ea1 family protein [Dyadobacter fermentans]
MSLQKVMHRRKFMQRSMLGFSSAFILPSLLQSCIKDHDIPGPNPIGEPPLVGDSELDWNDLAKSAVTTGLSMAIPEGGEILSALVDIFWPSDKPSAWDEVKAQVEALVDQKIGDFEYQLVTEDLAGLSGLLAIYLDELNDGSNEEKLIQWFAVRNGFVAALPHFQAKGYELPLLGLFGQFANMYLSVLRDVVVKGKEWGRTDADHARDISTLTKTIQDFNNYTQNIYQNALSAKIGSTGFVYKQAEPFRTVNAFERQMTFLVLDFQNLWKYYDITQYPNGTGDAELITREVYSDPMGTGANSDIRFTVPTPMATQFPTVVDVWSNDKYFTSVQMTYPPNSGLGGVTQTPKYGTPDGAHRTYNLAPSNPVTTINVTSGGGVNTVQFILADGEGLDILGVDPGGNKYTVGYPNEGMSSAYIQEAVYINNHYIAAVMVFGFRYWRSPAAQLHELKNLYVKSPKERSGSDFEKASPKLGNTANLITAELKAARQAYWTAVKVRAAKYR